MALHFQASRTARLVSASLNKTCSKRAFFASISQEQQKSFFFADSTLGASLLASTALLLSALQANNTSCEKAETLYTVEEVSKHNSQENGIWVTYKGGVYDVTAFAAAHPGGAAKLQLAAGGALEPYWALYGQHNQANVRELLAQYRIGALKDPPPAQTDAADPYKDDPPRHPALLVNSAKPFNAEPPPALLMDAFLTPNELFYKRNHLPVPLIRAEDYRLEVEVPGKGSVTFTLAELKAKFAHHTVTATMQCAGNRRADMARVKPLRGLSWGGTAIGNAEWTGVRLRDVLRHCGLDEAGEEALPHVHFESLDRDTEKCYAVSIPTEKAMDARGDTLLAWGMNGEDLPRDHGYPLRVVVPGVVGARNVKWLGKIVAAPAESTGHWQVKDYKGFSPSVDWDDNPDFENAPSIQELPVQSMMTVPGPGLKVSPGEEVEVKGYAWAGGGRGIVRVDVSADGGRTWGVATLRPPGQPPNRSWAWTPFVFAFTVPRTARPGQSLELICKAIDSHFNQQPDTFAPTWNLRGVLSNAWHRVPLEVVAEEEED